MTVVGRLLPDSAPLSERPYQTHRMRLLFRKGKLFYLEYNLRLFLYLLVRPVDILNANDLDTLLANFLVARLRGKRLVYDSHEYFTEVPELIHRPRTRAVWLRLERWLFPKLESVYTVNGSLARLYQEQYQVPVQVIRNVPFSRPLPSPVVKDRVLLYQGALNLGRGIELMIAAMAYLPDCQLWLVGKGDLFETLQEQATATGYVERIRFWGFVPLEELAKITQQARIGLSLEEDLGANYRYASPNKVYDYIQAGVPVLVSDLPEMRATVETYEVGEILAPEEREPQVLARRLLAMLAEEESYAQWQRACLRAARELNWEQEKQKLLAIYL